MSDLSDIHDKINSTKLTVEKLDSKFDTMIPFLATTEHVTEKIATHSANPAAHPKRNSTPPKASNGIDTRLKIGGVVATPVTIYGLFEIVRWMISVFGV